MRVYRAGPRGCDMACKATWLCHMDTRDGLRGTDVTREALYIFTIYYFSIMDIGLPCLGRQIISTSIMAYIIYVLYPSIFSKWD